MVNDGRTRLIVFILGDPHLLKGRKRCKDRSSDPDRVLSLRGSNDLDLHGSGGKSLDFLFHTFSNTVEHGGSTRKNDVTVKVLTDIDITLHDRVVSGLMNTFGFLTNHGRLEEDFGATEAFITDGDDLTIRQFIVLLETRGLSSSLHFFIEVNGDVAELFLDITDNFTFSGGGERVTTLSEDLHEGIPM